ncbi:MAG: OmpH family outer membrane protein [Paludibacteraceae bacterium]|nr:OmpH family outer membrane protein [Paludibacteraceae bacterium]
MNKTQIIIDSVLGVAVVVLFVLFFTSKSQSPVASSAPLKEYTGEALPIAYLNIDSILLNYSFAIEANEKLVSKQEDARLKLNTKLRTLQNEMQEFQRKYENNAFLSAERAQKEYEKLQKKQQDLQLLEQKLSQEILEENQALNLQLADSLTSYLNIFNADGRYQIILSNTAKDNVLMSDDRYDITKEVVEGMNARYNKK